MTNPQDPYPQQQPGRSGSYQPNQNPMAAPPLSQSELGGPQNLPAPQPVQISFWIWVATAALGVIGAVVGFTQRDAAVAALRGSASVRGLTEAQIQTAATVGVAVAAVFAIIFAGLYVLFAFKARAGRNWARIVLTVLTVLHVLSLATGFSVLAGISALAAVVALVLLYLPASSQFYAASKRVR
ncbi:hypothetical protein [Kutzneria sp. NPDC051319]|uniref:hypothetical protein n=1 Tax=Kutzneria sp. NPDC051319 TaxID=3155047 RepID=UPI00343C8CC3